MDSKTLADQLKIPLSSIRPLFFRPSSSDQQTTAAFIIQAPDFDSKVKLEAATRQLSCRTQIILPKYLHTFISSFRRIHKQIDPNTHLFFRPTSEGDAFNVSTKQANVPNSKFQHKEKIVFPFPTDLISSDLAQRCKSTLLTPEDLAKAIPNSYGF